MSFSVIIPSKNADNLSRCVEAVLRCEPEMDPRRIVVIDDGARENSAVQGVTWITGVKPFVFARNCNLGITFSCDDVILLNDDALLQTPGGFSAMAEASQGWGVVSAATNCGSGCQQAQGQGGVRLVATHVPAFICAYIPRETIATVGLLDERFTAYGHDDNDYVKRTRLAGLKVGVFDGCFVDHRSLSSTYRGKPGAPGDIAAGRKIYEAKYGVGAN
jgi:GT2 family glycosyltransferase